MVERVAPFILELLADAMPRTKPAIVEALAGRHDRQDVVHALIRLAVTGRVEETGGRYGPWRRSAPKLHTGSIVPWREGCSRGGRSNGSGAGGVLRSST
jgi:hypothetical protein